jgi:hypothetical protein
MDAEFRGTRRAAPQGLGETVRWHTNGWLLVAPNSETVPQGVGAGFPRPERQPKFQALVNRH